jgi:hypothetical protein
MLDNASDQFAMENMIFNSLSITNLVEDVNNANGQDRSQIQPELLASLDHQSSAQIASPEDQMKDTTVNNAHLDKFKTHKTCLDVSPEHALDNTRLLSHTIHNNVEDVKTANGQDSCLINSSLNAFQDHSPNATAEKSIQLIDTLVSHAQLASFKIQTTLRDA